MATKASRTIPNGTLYNYNPFTNIMPPNESWLYYKYTTTDVDLVHDLSRDLNKILLDTNGDADIFVLYAGGGSYGGYYWQSPDTDLYHNIEGGGGGSGEVNLTKLNWNNISNKKINFTIGGLKKNTIVHYSNTINISYGNINDADNNFGAHNAFINNPNIFNKIGNLAYSNNILCIGSCGAQNGSGSRPDKAYRKATIVMCNENENKTVLNQTNIFTTLYGYQKYTYDLNYYYLLGNFSNKELKSDSTGVGVILKSGYTPYGNLQPGQDGPNGFVMIFYKIKLVKNIIKPGIEVSNFNPLNNNISLNGKSYVYYLYKNINNGDYTHTVNISSGNFDDIIADINGKYTITILYQGGGGKGGNRNSNSGGGGGGGGGEILKTDIEYKDLLNGQIKLSVGNSGNSTSISNIFNQLTKYTANSGKNGSTATSAEGANGGDGLTIITIDNNTISYGSGSGGGGGGYGKKSNSGRSGTIQNGVNSPATSSSRTQRCVQIPDIGDGTGEILKSYGGSGGSGEKSGSSGDNGFVLIYYQVRG
jgi:hypothetical protein